MHILLIHQAFTALNEPGGTRHHELARFLVEKGHKVTVIASPVSYLTGKTSSPRQPSIQLDAESGLTILRVFTYPALHRSFVHRVYAFISFMLSSFLAGLRVSQVDLVWGSSPPIFQAFSAWALARFKRSRFLLEVRDLWPDFAIGAGVLRSPILIRLSRWLERFLYQHADQVMVNSPGFINHVSTHGARQVVLVPNGVDPGMFDPSASGEAFRQAHGLTDKFIVLYAGAHGMSNDLGVVLEAAHLLHDRPDISIVLLGDGKEKPALIRRARELSLSNLHFLSPIPKLAIPEALAAADACLAILKPIPLYATVYPNKVFDYMAAGRPVILAIEGVIRQVVESVQAGIPISPGSPQEIAQAIRHLADSPQQGRSMGRRGRSYVENHFNRSELAAQLEKILQNLVNSKR